MSKPATNLRPDNSGTADAQPRTLVFIAYPQMGLLDLTGAQTVFWAATKALIECGLPGYALRTASLEGGPIQTAEGLVIDTEKLSDLNDVQIDTLITPGTPHIRLVMADCVPLVDWLRVASLRARRTASVCSGTCLLALAGLLDGRRAATHWVVADLFESLFPWVQLDRDAIFVKHDSVWTSAGVSAGIDLALAMVEADCGLDVSLQVARRLVVFYRRPDNQEQWRPQLHSQQQAIA